jgi:hypothetical protein
MGALSNPDEARFVFGFLGVRLEGAGSVDFFLMPAACLLISGGGVLAAN